jgi:hypothetical protein
MYQNGAWKKLGMKGRVLRNEIVFLLSMNIMLTSANPEIKLGSPKPKKMDNQNTDCQSFVWENEQNSRKNTNA